MSEPSQIEAALDAWPSLPAMFFDQAARLAEHPLLWFRQEGRWQSRSWAEVADDVRRAARGLAALGVGRGDRVALVSENRPEWLITDFAAMMLGAVTVPAYTTSTTADFVHLLKDSGCRLAVVSTAGLLRKVLPAALQAPDMKALVSLDGTPSPENTGIEVLQWAEMLARGAAVDLPPIDLARADPACIIYTSGTGGAPKGVLLSHGNILANCRGAFELLAQLGIGDERFLSFLPLSHAYEHSCGQMFPLSVGAEIAYAESIEKLAGNLGEMRPTVMTAVPRLYEVLQTRIRRDVERAGGLRQRLFDRTVALGIKRYRQGGRLNPLDALQDRLLDRIVRDAVRARFGGRLKAFVSGGAPLSPDLGLFFHALGIRILQGYGQTEAAPLISVNPPHRPRHETVGLPVHGTELRIGEDGEILVRGPQVMLGYWNDPAATERTLDGGWLHTGDIGHIEPDGYLVITDRKKDIIVTSGGDNVAPQRIENLLSLEPEIGQSMVIGDRRPYLVALIVPERDLAFDWARRHDRPQDMAALVQDEDYRKVIGEAVDRVNRRLSGLERIRRFTLLAEPFSIENGELTPTLKIRRHVIRQHYADRIDALYGS